MSRATDDLDAAALRAIVEGTASETGEAFFEELVKHLAGALGTHGAWVTEWLPEPRRLRALAFWAGGRQRGPYEYDVQNTPCEPVVENRRLVHVPDRVVELFPKDDDVRGMASYLGVPLLDTDGALLGHLAVLHTEPMPEDPRVLDVFRIFAGRAAAELRRVRRDRDLREREQQLSRLFDSALDAIVELDAELRIVGANRAAERTFGAEAARLVGRPFAACLGDRALGKLRYLVGTLDRQPDDTPSLAIPDGLDARRSDGSPFPAEATVSRFTVAGRARYALILRDVDARLAAEARIRALLSETAALRSELAELHGFDDILGDSDALRRVLADVERVAPEDTTVLVTGETGTGKELVARAVHRRSPRAARRLVAVNCAAIPAGLQESEFFGHERGAFTGATQRREGRFKLADGGTIFLDEVGELPLDLQAKLLRVLQHGELEPVGGTRTERVDVRVVCATNRDLGQMVDEGTFRRDLLYRLNVFPIHVPPLRERGDDVVLLADAFVRRLAARRGVAPAPLSPDAKARLRRYDWPGNVRELENVVERAWITSLDGRTLNLDRALPEADARARSVPPAPPDGEAILTALEVLDLERRNVRRALDACGWKIAGPDGAAARLGLKPNTLASRLKSLGIERPRAR